MQLLTKQRTRLCGYNADKNLLYCKRLVDSGTTSTSDLAILLQKSKKQTRRYIKKLAQRGLVFLDSKTGRLQKTVSQCLKVQYEALSDGEFRQLPEIKKWINDCIARGLHPKTIANMANSIKRLCNLVRIYPKQLTISKKSATDLWLRFAVEFRKQYPTKGTHIYRVSFKNFLASFDITFGHGMCKVHGLSSAHDRFGAYAGVHLSSGVTKKLGDIMLLQNDLETYLWFRVGLRTGARSSAIASMMWEKIYDEKNENGSESFKIEQHETKDKLGHYHLGLNGDWKTKYPPLDLKNILLQWKEKNPKHSRFVWFEDRGHDVGNLSAAMAVRRRISTKMKSYYKRIENEVDSLTKEYMYKKPDHLMRHTFAQQLKEAGFTSEEIAEAGGWRDAQTVAKWYSRTSYKKKRELSIRAAKVVF